MFRIFFRLGPEWDPTLLFKEMKWQKRTDNPIEVTSPNNQGIKGIQAV